MPRRRRGLVARPRLSALLGRGSDARLTLVSAPAGFGKTTLLAEWFAGYASESPAGSASDSTAGSTFDSTAGSTSTCRAAAWLSLDERDNDPVRFWTYLVAALRTALTGAGSAAPPRLEPPEPPDEAGLVTLLNDLSALPDDVVLVLDDYHLIEDHQVLDGMAFLVEHLPPQLHLVLAGRADPALPLSRLRARGELVEVRAADLRFTPDEVGAYLRDAMGLELTPADVATLEGRTEGWVAALQLAAISLQGRTDSSGFIAAFAGNDRYLVDYLVEEVLDRQPDDVRLFLLRTSILERLTGALCDAVTGQRGGESQLARLERANLFLVALDDRRRWYRYHQLFADVLLAHLRDEYPDEVPVLHRRASDWYEEQGDRAAAISHALAGHAFERAADLVELAIPATRSNRQESALRGWLRRLPDSVVRQRPVLSVGYAGALLAVGEVGEVERRLQEAERWLDAPTDAADAADPSAPAMRVVDEAEFRRLPAEIQLYRAALALRAWDVPETIRRARRARELSAADDHLPHAAASGLLGLAYWASGDLEAGHDAYADCAAGLLRAGHVADTFGCAIGMADIRLVQGRLGAALSTYQRTLADAQEAGGPADGESVLRGTADMHVGMSQVFRERNDLPAAREQLRRSLELGEHKGLPQNPYRWRLAMARLRQAEGDLDAALDLLQEAERRYVSDFFPDVRPVAAVRAGILAASGRLAEALEWVGARGLSVDDELSYLHEFEHLALARVLLAEYASEGGTQHLDDAVRLLARLLDGAVTGGRTGSVLEILVLQALAHQAGSDVPAALLALERAVALAQPEGYVRVFLDEGPPMTTLLWLAVKDAPSPAYLEQLLAAADSADNAVRPPVARLAKAQAQQQPLVEPLSERELDVLRLLASELDGPDIARRLFVSLNTVRTHTNHIYAKLGVNNRRAAVRRALELDLLTTP